MPCSSLQRLRQRMGIRGPPFVTFDERLALAASKEGFPIIGPV